MEKGRERGGEGERERERGGEGEREREREREGERGRGGEGERGREREGEGERERGRGRGKEYINYDRENDVFLNSCVFVSRCLQQPVPMFQRLISGRGKGVVYWKVANDESESTANKIVAVP